jgi:NAD(P)-dependent dehydrogenase (short-subunit alcohol dehydrogenase family)
MEIEDRVALVTGGAGGIGSAVARALAEQGARVVIADVDVDGGQKIARELDGQFVATDVSDPDACLRAVEHATTRYGGLDLVHLNAGVASRCGVGEDFDLAEYRRVMGINLDGVVFGMHAALPALRARGGGAVVATASLAGLTAVPLDPLYSANKHAVVGFVRSLGPGLALEGIRVNAVCPGFAESAIIDPIRDALAGEGVPIIPAEQVAATVMTLFTGEMSGECWFVQAGRESDAFAFRGIPGPRPVA